MSSADKGLVEVMCHYFFPKFLFGSKHHLALLYFNMS
jgi:hypothetical protein